MALSNQKITEILRVLQDKHLALQLLDLSSHEEKISKFAYKYMEMHSLEVKPYNAILNEHEFDGKKITEDNPEVMIHNVNHFRLAPISRRNKPDFGLGGPPEDNDRYFLIKAPLVTDREQREDEENMVLTLDLLISLEQGYRLQKISILPNSSFLRKGLYNLHHMGIIDSNGVVNYTNLRQSNIKIQEPSNW